MRCRIVNHLACGIDRSEVKEDHTVKSIGRVLTFEEVTSDPELVKNISKNLISEFT